MTTSVIGQFPSQGLVELLVETEEQPETLDAGHQYSMIDATELMGLFEQYRGTALELEHKIASIEKSNKIYRKKVKDLEIDNHKLTIELAKIKRQELAMSNLVQTLQTQQGKQSIAVPISQSAVCATLRKYEKLFAGGVYLVAAGTALAFSGVAIPICLAAGGIVYIYHYFAS